MDTYYSLQISGLPPFHTFLHIKSFLSMTQSSQLVYAVSDSERADPHYCRDRLTEGSNINKSLVTLGIVISVLGK